LPWHVKDEKFYVGDLPHTIVTLNNSKFVYREIGGPWNHIHIDPRH